MNSLSRTTWSILRPSSSPRFCQPLVPPQVRHASILGSLSDVPAAYNKRIRRGRGPSSGKGKTSGRGHKGQKQHGKVPRGFQGGQTPLEVVHGVRGFKNVFSVEMSPLNVGKLQQWIDAGRIDPTKPITFKELLDARAVHGIKDGVKLLGDGAETFKTPIDITVSRASQTAIEAIEKAGGKVTTKFFNKIGIKSITHPHLFPDGHRLAGPSSRFDIEYYRDPKHRGYLSEAVVANNESASLFFKALEAKPAKGGKKKAKKAKAANRLF
ncbi:ribosomal protein L18e/L15P [Sphaerosporella brunnea]|uniref:Ribosomal protein L18e/L15P n=1 Tax=Sphaerosporella brunnea TaxID=1250544 RepID=A0A5J5ECX7_9PEZI|nr:ribosomal protein L18e/L15P [Sphaerosporella brunnea]